MTSRDLESPAHDAIILAGGAGTRLGGVDKSAVDVAGRSLLNRAVGPQAGLAADLRRCQRTPGPLSCSRATCHTSADITRLLEALPGHDAALFTDVAGWAQPLAAAYRAAALHTAVGALGDVHSQPVRRILDGMNIVRVDDHGASRDCDTPDQLECARMALR